MYSNCLSKMTLESLGKNELISLCVYFDIEWRTTIFDMRRNEVYKSSHVVSHCHLVSMLASLFDTSVVSEGGRSLYMSECVIVKYGSVGVLYEGSPVLYGEFSRKNAACVELCRRMGIRQNKRSYEYMYRVWGSGRVISYKELLDGLSVDRANYGYSRSMFKYHELVSYLP